ncbi:MAG: CPXCG motif-containing cysteine-rich protein [Vampirovibrionales bacterium]|nr:CPXCG motif-containing cysteine-rich protein [Vampirovibrionales bacterium]
MNAEFTCAYCFSSNPVWVDASGGLQQQYIEDCQTCCQPNQLYISAQLDAAEQDSFDFDTADNEGFEPDYASAATRNALDPDETPETPEYLEDTTHPEQAWQPVWHIESERAQ